MNTQQEKKLTKKFLGQALVLEQKLELHVCNDNKLLQVHL